MPNTFIVQIRRAQQTLAACHRRIRRIQDELLPRAEARLSKSDASISKSITRELETRDRVDPLT